MPGKEKLMYLAITLCLGSQVLHNTMEWCLSGGVFDRMKRRSSTYAFIPVTHLLLLLTQVARHPSTRVRKRDAAATPFLLLLRKLFAKNEFQCFWNNPKKRFNFEPGKVASYICK